MNRTTIRAVRDQHDQTMFRLPELGLCRDNDTVYFNSILIIFKYDEEDKPRNGYNSLVQARTQDILIPNIKDKLAKGYDYIFMSYIVKDWDPEIKYQDPDVILHKIKGCDEDGFLWCKRMSCIELYKLVGKKLYNSILRRKLGYGTVHRF